MVLDARFGYHYWAHEKKNIVNGYFEYLDNKMKENSAPRTIFLAGHSRGGCLVMLLAQKFTSKYPHTRVIVDNYDEVCTIPRKTIPGYVSEFGVTSN